MKSMTVIIYAFGLFLIQHVTCMDDKKMLLSTEKQNPNMVLDEKHSSYPPRNVVEESAVTNPKHNPILLQKLKREVEESTRLESGNHPTNVHAPHMKYKRSPRWNFTNITGNISGISMDGVDISNANNITCTDGHRNLTGLKFENIKGNIGNMTCYVVSDGKQVKFDGLSFNNISGDISNIHITGGGGNSEDKSGPNNSPRQQWFIYNMHPALQCVYFITLLFVFA